MNRDLHGIHVVVAGAGLAGLVAARELERLGARVSVIEARDRIGGRVHTFLAGGSASAQLRRILAEEGDRGLLVRLSWLGSPGPIVDTRVVAWEEDPWSGGGYAHFDPAFDPCLREWLARPAGRVVFAGEHTSMRWQGFMSGAIESGRRAAAEVPYLAASDTART